MIGAPCDFTQKQPPLPPALLSFFRLFFLRSPGLPSLRLCKLPVCRLTRRLPQPGRLLRPRRARPVGNSFNPAQIPSNRVSSLPWPPRNRLGSANECSRRAPGRTGDDDDCGQLKSRICGDVNHHALPAFPSMPDGRFIARAQAAAEPRAGGTRIPRTSPVPPRHASSPLRFDVIIIRIPPVHYGL